MKKFLIIIIFISCLFTLSLNHIYAIVPPPYKIVLYEYDKPLTEKSAVLISGNPYGAARTWGLCEKGICYIDAGSNYVIHFYIFSKNIDSKLNYVNTSLNFKNGDEQVNYLLGLTSESEYSGSITLNRNTPIAFRYDLKTSKLTEVDYESFVPAPKASLGFINIIYFLIVAIVAVFVLRLILKRINYFKK